MPSFFGGDIKVGSVLKRLPAHSDSAPTNLERSREFLIISRSSYLVFL